MADPNLNAKIESFRFDGSSITNYEMESSAIAGLSKMMGHKAMTVCTIIANRVALDSDANYKGSIEELLKTVLEKNITTTIHLCSEMFITTKMNSIGYITITQIIQNYLNLLLNSYLV